MYYIKELQTVVQAYNPSSMKAEAGGSWVGDQHSEPLSQKAKQQKCFLVQNNVDGKYDIDIDRINSIIDNMLTPFDSPLTLKEKLEYDKEKIVIEAENQETMEFDRSDIALVRLAFDF